MLTAGFWCENERSGVRHYYVYLYERPWYASLWRSFILWLDPHCRRPWWLWYGMGSLWERAVYVKTTAKVEVTEEWALENFDFHTAEEPM